MWLPTLLRLSTRGSYTGAGDRGRGSSSDVCIKAFRSHTELLSRQLHGRRSKCPVAQASMAYGGKLAPAVGIGPTLGGLEAPVFPLDETGLWESHPLSPLVPLSSDRHFSYYAL